MPAFRLMRTPSAVLIALGLTCPGEPALAQPTAFDAPVVLQGAVTQNISYGPDPQQILDVCQPEGKAGVLHPGILMVHGGGWRHGSKAGLMGKWCKRFAQAGFVAIDMNYRLFVDPKTTPQWPQFQIGDVQLAIRWARAHAHEIGLDPQRLCGYGASAGGYLVVYAGAVQTIEPSDVAAIAPDIPVGLSCVVDAFGPVDLTDPNYHLEDLASLVGATYDQNPNLYKAASPLFRVDAKMPPTLIIHGSHDGQVPIAQSQKLSDALKAENIHTEFVTYQGTHNYNGLSPEQLDAMFQTITRFLKSQVGG
jgi:acetyl esterase/lipase